MAGSETLTSGEYIKHHLTNLTFGKFPDGHWGIAHSAEDASSMGFSAIHLDSMFWSIALAALFGFYFYKAAQKATAGVPSGLQNFVEMIIDFVNDSVRGSFSGKNDMVAPLALTV
ncbi:MAG: F0F1 ATP synthase subunit A, partial [Gammaproteobacteria bacterium]|nr:F0F1 ATP synthase subunit A [Gammaproteobacteria bacterium]